MAKIKHEAGSGNVFADLSVPNPEEALAKADLAAAICRIIAERGWTRTQTAKQLGLDSGDVVRLQSGRHERFSIEQMRQFLNSLLPDQIDGRRGSPLSRRE